MSFKAEIKASLGWNWSQGAVDSNRLDYTRQMLEGNGDGQAEAVWHLADGVLASGESLDLDLTALVREVLGAALTTTFLRVKSLLVVNEGSSAGRLVVGAAGSDEWSAPFGADGDTMAVPPDGTLLAANRAGGWPVDDQNKLLRLAAIGGAVDYSIAIIGTLTAEGSGSSGT